MAGPVLLRLIGRIPAFGAVLADACHRAGIALQKQDAQENAARYFLWSLALAPARPAVLNDLGLALIAQDLHAAAVPWLREATQAAPRMVPAWFNLGVALGKIDETEEALAAFRKALELRPELAEAWWHIGNLLHASGRLPEAEAAFRQALAIEEKPASWNNLANLLSRQGRLPEAIAAYRKALAIKPEPYVFSNLLLTLNYSDEYSPRQIFEEHLAFQRAFAADLPDGAPTIRKDAGATRLRIGYVSPDFRNHPVAFFLLPLLEHHDRDRFEVFGYCINEIQDGYTARIRGVCDHWRETRKFDADRMARQVREDGIDILVDLAGHTADNDLLAFARRPAPVQASWLGYLNTTGLAAMDYRIADAVTVPPGEAEALHTEKVLRLPDCQWCYEPPADSPDVAPLPGASNAGLTFGGFHNPAKMTPPVIALWSGILAALPEARLILAAAGLDSMAGEIAARFAAHGVDPARVEILGIRPLADYMALHGRIDISLDTFPYSGGTTTCHSLWMGVPVLTLPGALPASRGGASLLTALGLTEFIAGSQEEYLEIARRADSDRAGLAKLRAGLRGRMRESPVMDGRRFARNMESAYLSMWREKTEGSRAS